MSDGYNPYDYASKDAAPAYSELSALSPYQDEIHPPSIDQSTPHINGTTIGLPLGWTQYLTEQGLPYYVNGTSGVTQWQKPSQSNQPAPPVAPYPSQHQQQPKSDSYPIKISSPSSSSNSTSHYTPQSGQQRTTGLLSDDIIDASSSMYKYQGSRETYDANNSDTSRHQYDHAHIYPYGPDCRFLENVPISNKKNEITRNCDSIPRQIFLWLIAIGTFGCLVLAIIGHLMPLEEKSWGREMSTTALLFVIMGWTFWGTAIMSFGLWLGIELCTSSITSPWSTYPPETTSFLSSQTSLWLSFTFSCCTNFYKDIEKNPKIQSYDDFTHKYHCASNLAIPTLKLHFEGYTYAGIGKTTKVLLTKTVTVPIVGHRDISPLEKINKAPLLPSLSSLTTIDYEYSYILPSEQQYAVDYLKRCMIEKWAEKGKYFTITESYTIAVPPGPNHENLDDNILVYSEGADTIGNFCCFNSFFGSLWLFVIGCYGCHYSWFKWSTGAKMKIHLVKAIQLGEIPKELE